MQFLQKSYDSKETAQSMDDAMTTDNENTEVIEFQPGEEEGEGSKLLRRMTFLQAKEWLTEYVGNQTKWNWPN